MTAHGLLKLLATRLAPLSNIKGRRGVATSGRILGHDSLFGRKLRFGLRPIRVAQTMPSPGAVVVRKSLKSTGEQPRRHTSFTDLTFAVHEYRPGFGAETSFFTHLLEFVPHLHPRRHASGSARTEGISSKESGLQTNSSSLTNGLSQPRSHLLRTQTLLVEGKRENGCQR